MFVKNQTKIPNKFSLPKKKKSKNQTQTKTNKPTTNRKPNVIDNFRLKKRNLNNVLKTCNPLSNFYPKLYSLRKPKFEILCKRIFELKIPNFKCTSRTSRNPK